jgi:hypothetical protein
MSSILKTSCYPIPSFFSFFNRRSSLFLRENMLIKVLHVEVFSIVFSIYNALNLLTSYQLKSFFLRNFRAPSHRLADRRRRDSEPLAQVGHADTQLTNRPLTQQAACRDLSFVLARHPHLLLFHAQELGHAIRNKSEIDPFCLKRV